MCGGVWVHMPLCTTYSQEALQREREEEERKRKERKEEEMGGMPGMPGGMPGGMGAGGMPGGMGAGGMPGSPACYDAVHVTTNSLLQEGWGSSSQTQNYYR